MAAFSKATLTGKVRRWSLEGYQNEPLRMIELIQLQGRKGQNVEAWNFESKIDTEKLKSILDEMEKAANEDADGGRGTQTYAFLAYFGKNSNYSQRYKCEIYGSFVDVDGDEAMDSEEATPRGMRAAEMRHDENLHKLYIGGIGETYKTLRAENVSLREQVSGYQKHEIEMMGVIQQLYDHKALRDIQIDKAARRAKIEDQVSQGVLLFLPSIVNRIAGSKILPEQSSPQAAMMNQLLDTLTEDQLAKLNGILTPTQMVPVVELIKSHLDAKEEREKEEAKKLTGVAPIAQLST